MRTSRGSSKRGTGRTTGTKRIVATIPQENNCAYLEEPVDNHLVKIIGISINGRHILFCLNCECIVGGKRQMDHI
jgi:predicted ester cyclase